MTLFEEIAAYLQAQNVGTYDSTGVTGNIFDAVLPDTPDTCIMIRVTGGTRADSRVYGTPGFQLITRGTSDPRVGEALAQRVFNALNNKENIRFATGGRWIISCLSMQGGPAHIGMDANGRHEYSVNFRLRTSA